MGEVYRARDTRLVRDVAIKVLPRAFSSDAGRLARFDHEARATAALNHPNILAVYDINVWIALTHASHVHHLVASDWFESLQDEARLCFCRFTQLGFLRLLTAEGVIGDEVLSQREAWSAYDGWLSDDRVSLVDEPHGLEQRLRPLTGSRRASPKVWADAYLIAFAATSQMTLVTFDRAFRGRTKPLILLSD